MTPLKICQLFFLMLLLSGCCETCYIHGCPEPINYSKEFQRNLALDLERANSYYLNQAAIDLFNLNKQLRECRNINGL